MGTHWNTHYTHRERVWPSQSKALGLLQREKPWCKRILAGHMGCGQGCGIVHTGPELQVGGSWGQDPTGHSLYSQSPVPTPQTEPQSHEHTDINNRAYPRQVQSHQEPWAEQHSSYQKVIIWNCEHEVEMYDQQFSSSQKVLPGWEELSFKMSRS